MSFSVFVLSSVSGVALSTMTTSLQLNDGKATGSPVRPFPMQLSVSTHTERVYSVYVLFLISGEQQEMQWSWFFFGGYRETQDLDLEESLETFSTQISSKGEK